MYSNNIKQYRLNKNLTLTKLAELSCLSTSYLCRLENGSKNNPTFNSMLNISKALDKPIYQIFAFEKGNSKYE